MSSILNKLFLWVAFLLLAISGSVAQTAHNPIIYADVPDMSIIRVGNVYDDGGNLIGNSGPFYPDSHELSWGADFPRVTPEITTVTKRVRRIAGWSNFQYLDALQLNRPDRVYLTFINYMRGLAAFNQRVDNMRLAHKTIGKYPQIYASWGPRVDQVAKVPEDQDRSMMEFVFSGAFQ